MDLQLQDEIRIFFYRWDALERTLGERGSSFLDFDLLHLPPADLVPYADRYEAFQSLNVLRRDVTHADEKAFLNRPMIEEKLRGADFFLRTLLGEQIPFPLYFEKTMGAPPLLDLKAALSFLDRRVPGGALPGEPPEIVPKAVREERIITAAEFAEGVSAAADKHCALICDTLGFTADVQYRIELDSDDAYWKCWIDGGEDGSIRMRVNSHPRHVFRESLITTLGGHEISGHALQFSLLREQVRTGAVDPALAILTNFSSEMFQFEGLAQIVGYFLCQIGAADPRAYLREHYLYRYDTLLGSFQLRLENGESAAEVYAEAAEISDPLFFSSVVDLVNRFSVPLMRSYRHVYPPSWQFFRRTLEQLGSKSSEFMKLCYTNFYTPTQLAALRDQLLVSPEQ